MHFRGLFRVFLICFICILWVRCVISRSVTFAVMSVLFIVAFVKWKLFGRDFLLIRCAIEKLCKWNFSWLWLFWYGILIILNCFIVFIKMLYCNYSNFCVLYYHLKNITIFFYNCNLHKNIMYKSFFNRLKCSIAKINRTTHANHLSSHIRFYINIFALQTILLHKHFITI